MIFINYAQPDLDIDLSEAALISATLNYSHTNWVVSYTPKDINSSVHRFTITLQEHIVEDCAKALLTIVVTQYQYQGDISNTMI